MAARGVKAGNAYIELAITGGQKLRQGLSGITRQFTTFAKVATGALGVLGPGAFATGSLRYFTDLGDQLDKMSKRTGVGVEALSELKFAAEQSGTNIDQLGQAMFRMSRRVANATTGTGPAVRALQEMGLSAEALSNLSAEDRFEAIVEALGGVANEGRRAQMAFELFGDNARQIMPLLNEGAAGIRTLREEAAALGGTVTTEQAQQAAALADRWNQMKTLIRGVMIDLGAAMAPLIEDMIEGALKIAIGWEVAFLSTKKVVLNIFADIRSEMHKLTAEMGSWSAAFAEGFARAFGDESGLAAAFASTFRLGAQGQRRAGDDVRITNEQLQTQLDENLGRAREEMNRRLRAAGLDGSGRRETPDISDIALDELALGGSRQSGRVSSMTAGGFAGTFGGSVAGTLAESLKTQKEQKEIQEQLLAVSKGQGVFGA